MNIALARYQAEQDKADQNGELLERNREKVVQAAMDMVFESIQLEEEAFIDIVNGESLREGDYSEINVLMNKIEIAGRTNDALASGKAAMELGTFLYRKWVDGMIARHWDKASEIVLQELKHNPNEV